MFQLSTAIDVRQLSKRLGGRQVLCDVEFRIAAGECVALTGDNGAGKTTLLRCLAALVPPTTGEIHWFGHPATTRSDRKRLVGVVAHESRVYCHLSVRENLLFAARMYGISRPASRTDQLLEQAAMQQWSDRPVREVSKGMRRRLALCRALIHEPPLLLLDEPFVGLDQTSCDGLVNWLQQRPCQGQTICFTTHDPQRARQLASRILRLQGGRLVEVTASSDDRRHQVSRHSDAA